MPLDEYRQKRDFRLTAEPAGEETATEPEQHPTIFVVQEHHASHLHYDFRLEAEGVLKSWSVPRGPSLDPRQKRLAVEVEDHPISYAGFEGTIPEGRYGGGRVRIWDRGTYENRTPARSVGDALRAGRLVFTMHGQKLRGAFSLIRMRTSRGGKPQWLLIKGKDAQAESDPSGPAPAGPRSPKTPAARSKKVRPRAAPPPDEVVVTHPEKPWLPDAGLTKGDVFRYYDRIADRLLPFLKDRPATLERLPHGLGEPDAPHFWQKDTPAHYPDRIPRVELPSERGRPVRYALVNDRATLLYLVNQGTLTFHVWASRVESLDVPDSVLFDLDPGPAPFAWVVEIARSLRRLLADDGRDCCVKTSGKSGLHVLAPWAAREGDDDAARAWALDRAEAIARALPDRATVEIRKEKRGGRVYVDVLQNARGHHAVPPFVVRAIPRGTVSTPLRWDEVKAGLDPAAFTPARVLRRVRRLASDPMAPLRGTAGRDHRPRKRVPII